MRQAADEAMAAALAVLSVGTGGIHYASDRSHAGAVKLAVALIERDTARMALEAARLRGKAGRGPDGGGA